MLVLISAFRDKLLEMVEPKYVKDSTTPSVPGVQKTTGPKVFSLFSIVFNIIPNSFGT